MTYALLYNVCWLCTIEYFIICCCNIFCRSVKKKSSSTSANRSQDDALYPVTVVPSANSTNNYVKIHYIGYSSSFDEWRYTNDIVHLGPSPYILEDYSFNEDLALKIKSSLTSQRKVNPMVRIEMMYDRGTFDKGPRMKGRFKQRNRGVEHYTIDNYNELDSVLGSNWHYRGLNSAGDFCYVMLRTVDFYLYCKRPLIHYIEKDNKPVKICVPQGYVLVFQYVCGDGPSSQFGNIDSIFA